jgi:hypothetical protein
LGTFFGWEFGWFLRRVVGRFFRGMEFPCGNLELS